MAKSYDYGKIHEHRMKKRSPWTNDPRIKQLSDELVQTTAASLLTELGISPSDTTQCSINVAIAKFNEDRLKGRSLTRAQFLALIRAAMEDITGIIPEHLTLSSVDRNGDISVVYVI